MNKQGRTSQEFGHRKGLLSRIGGIMNWNRMRRTLRERALDRRNYGPRIGGISPRGSANRGVT
jgi:hypothetical protein